MQSAIALQNLLYAPDMMCYPISSSKARRKESMTSIGDSKNDLSKGFMKLIEKQNGVTRVIEIKTKEWHYEAAIKPLSIDKCCMSQMDRSKLLHCHFGQASKGILDRMLLVVMEYC